MNDRRLFRFTPNKRPWQGFISYFAIPFRVDDIFFIDGRSYAATTGTAATPPFESTSFPRYLALIIYFARIRKLLLDAAAHATGRAAPCQMPMPHIDTFDAQNSAIFDDA